MALSRIRRFALVAVILPLAGTSIGCPSLNRGSGPNQDPFFSVADPLPVTAAMEAKTKNGGLSDQAAPAR